MSQDTDRIFTESFKARNRIVASAMMVLASAAPFVVGLLLITYCLNDPVGLHAGLITAGAFIACIALTWLVQDRVALLGNDALRDRLLAKVGPLRDQIRCQGSPAFVGFSPGEDVRTWGGETDLDIGLLCLAEDSMCFLGDRFTWSLVKGRIDQIDLTPAIGPRRILVRWHAPREPRRAFTLESRDASSLTAAAEATVELFRGLRKWSVMETGDGAGCPVLGSPPTGEYDGTPIHQLAAGSCSVLLSMAVIIVLTTWYLVGQMLEDGYYCHAILWAGFVFVGGAVFTRCLLHYLQSNQRPRPRPRPSPGNPDAWPF